VSQRYFYCSTHIHSDNPCLVTVDTGVYLTVTRPDISAKRPERQADQRYTLQTASGGAFPGAVRSEFGYLSPISPIIYSWDGLNILRAYDASVDLGRQTLRLAEHGVSQWNPGLTDKLIPAQCEGLVMDRLESPRSRKWPGRSEPADPPA
jgi:hypothetical protein